MVQGSQKVNRRRFNTRIHFKISESSSRVKRAEQVTNFKTKKYDILTVFSTVTQLKESRAT